MFMYSCLGLLTLQIGVAVLAALFIVIAAMVIISNFLDIQSGTHIVPYLLVGLIAILLLLGGIMMFVAAYQEREKHVLLALILVAIILVLFIIASVMSFFNSPSLTKQICVRHKHCPETLWLASFNYKSGGGEETDSDTDYNYESTTHVDEGNSSNSSFEERYRTWRVINGEPNNIYSQNIKNLENSKSGIEQTEEPADFAVSFPLTLSALNVPQFKNSLRILRYVKRHLFSMLNQEKEEPSISELIMNEERHVRDAKIMRGDNQWVGQVTGYQPIDPGHDRNGGGTTSKNIYFPEDRGDDDTGSGGGLINAFNFGFDFLMALLVFLLIIGFLIFTMLVLWNYKKQLLYIKLYAVNPASQHYMI